MADPRAEEPDARRVLESDRNLFGHRLRELKTKEQILLHSNSGLDGKKWKSLSDSGRSLGISRERVRQIRDEAVGSAARRLTDALTCYFYYKLNYS